MKLKYFSINNLIRSPKILIRIANRKNRALRLMMDAITNIIKLILNDLLIYSGKLTQNGNNLKRWHLL